MVDGYLDSDLLVLKDNWPAVRNSNHPIPRDGFASSIHQNVATAAYQAGTKIEVRNKGDTGKEGFSTFIYLQVGVQNPYNAIAVKSVVVPDSAACWYKVTNDPDDCLELPTSIGAVALSAITDGYWGWFWCGGVCPEEWVATLTGNFATNGLVGEGPVRAVHLSADAIGFGPCEGSETYMGLSLGSDTVA